MTEESKIKSKSLFDHIKAITQGADAKYWNKLSESDKKSWSNFMVNRFLSMNDDWISLVNDLQPYTTGIQLKPEITFKLFNEIIPKSRVFLQYIKSKNSEKYNKELVVLLSKHYSVSQKEVMDYLHIFFSTKSGIESLEKIIKMYGIEDKQVKKLMKLEK